MRLLLDNHYLVWALAEPARLRAPEKVLIGGDAGDIACSVVSLWELRLKWSRFDISGQRKGPVDPETVRTFIQSAGWALLALNAEHAVTPLDVPIDHADPFDELLLVQAQVERVQLLTRDGKLIDHPLAYRHI